jgi:hypothetical protein
LAHIGDVEIVAVPKVEQQSAGLFEGMTTDVDLLDARMTALLDNHEVGQRRKSNGSLMSWGPTWKSVTFRDRPVDLFTPVGRPFRLDPAAQDRPGRVFPPARGAPREGAR